jgi:hypothetical protein
MKRPRLRAIVNFSIGLLFLSLLVTPARAAQQEVDPKHFDKSWGQAQPQKTVSHRKDSKKSQAHRTGKQFRQEQSRTRKRPQTPRPVSRSVGDEPRMKEKVDWRTSAETKTGREAHASSLIRADHGFGKATSSRPTKAD